MSQAQQSVLHLLAFQYLWSGQPEKAQPLYALLLSYAPEMVQVRTGLACAQLHNGAAQDALLSLAPLAETPDPVVQLLRSRAFSMLGDRLSASAAMQRFCQSRPPWKGPILVDVPSEEQKKTAKGVPKNA